MRLVADVHRVPYRLACSVDGRCRAYPGLGVLAEHASPRYARRSVLCTIDEPPLGARIPRSRTPPTKVGPLVAIARMSSGAESHAVLANQLGCTKGPRRLREQPGWVPTGVLGVGLTPIMMCSEPISRMW